MAFSSAAFVFAFLPAVFLLHLVIRGRLARNVLLLLASLLFYSAGSLPHLPLLVGVTLLNYLAGLLFRKRLRIRKAVLAVTLCLNVAVLALFKYLGFFGGVIGDLTGLSLRLPALALPIGVSFFTFQGMSYAIDVYRDPDSGTTDFFELLLYISFFPQLIAGPIVQYHDVAPQLRRRAADVRQMAEGFRRFIVGLSKKLLLADVLGTAVDALYARTDLLDARTALLVGIAYCLQIYFDFSGYSDMAIGMGRMFGFRFPENFDHPYTGSSIREFWRRWHISLSMWFRNYVYIPLGGSRRGLARTCFNTFVVFLLTGLWHGAMWTFVLWGLWNGFWLILERATPLKKVSHTLFGHVYMLLIVMLGFILFRAESLTQAGRICRALADFRFEREGTILLRGVLSAKVLAAGAVAVFLSTGLQRKLAEKLRRSSGCQAAEYAASLLCLALCVLRIASVSFNPFIYFRF
ncbi:MAG: MBOAT family protein [Oscillospiraceae bacterium]|nr:MBOAT family protein [Oscillospiraceae bacterium]